MQLLQELLHRIKWDAEFATGDFALGYFDRVARMERVCSFSSIDFDLEGGSFVLRGEDGSGARIPLHRVRAVYKDGRVIWQRPGGRLT